MYSHLILYCLYPRTYLHDCQALQDADQEQDPAPPDQEQEDPAPLEDAEADGSDDGSDDEDESADEESSIDASLFP